MGHQEAEAGKAVRRNLVPRLLVPGVLVLTLLAHAAGLPAQGPAPLTPAAVPAATALEAVRFAVIGDNGTGDQPQFDISRQMVASRTAFPYDFVLMVGDNMYVRATPRGYADAFERPYKTLLDAGVRFFAILGNHDDPNELRYPGFNMNGQRYYTFARGHTRFIALDTNVLDAKQIAWFENALKASLEPWKIVYFHHPLYSNGSRHGSNVELRVKLEPLLVRYGVNLVLSGHDHHYERFKPQKGVTYFVAGSGGKLRSGGVDSAPETAVAFAQEQAFMLVQVAGDELSFRAISRTGKVIDSGVIVRQPST
jgi:3',5'-cyclic AMP phosphodiesterase CpdA